MEDLLCANYYSILMDGSTDSSVIEKGFVYVLFLNNGTPQVKFFSIKSIKSADAEGLLSSLKESFKQIGILNVGNRLHGLNIDGASVNTGIHNGLGTRICDELSPWLKLIHYFNHQLELVIKDAFKGTFFSEIDTMLLKLYCLYKKSLKRLRDLKEFGEIFEKVVLKPSGPSGMTWIAHKVMSMEIMLANYGVFLTHLESLAQTDSQALKRAELVGFAKKWAQAKYLIHLALYHDILEPIKVLSLVMQQEIHNPVVQLRHIRDFTWSMTKLGALLQDSIDKTTTRLTNFTKFQKDVVSEEGVNKLQGIKLLNYDVSSESIKNSYDDIIKSLTNNNSKQFFESPITPSL